MPYRAFVFARPSGPQFLGVELGHVGWGFQIDDTRYVVGSVENPAGTPYSPAGRTGWWSEVTTTPFARFAAGPSGSASAYDTYKELLVNGPSVKAARDRSDALAREPYAVLGANCMDAVHSVLSAYGLRSLPSPSDKENYAPNDWFRHIAFPAGALSTPRSRLDVILYEHPEYQGARQPFCSDQAGLSIPDLRALNWASRASSLIARAGKVTLFTEAGFRGAKVELEPGRAYAFLGGWGRLAGSLIIEEAPRAFAAAAASPVPPPLPEAAPPTGPFE